MGMENKVFKKKMALSWLSVTFPGRTYMLFICSGQRQKPYSKKIDFIQIRVSQ